MKKKIMEILKNHSGQNPIKRGKLLKELHIAGIRISDREMRATIEEMVKQDRIPIGTTTAGYFWIESQQDLQDAIESLHKKAMSILERIKFLKQNYETFTGQLKLL